MPDWTPETWLIAAGRTRVEGDPLNVPPVFASNFFLPDERVYSRAEQTPTVEALETVIGGLEGGRALAFGSGMAAAATVFHRLAVGTHIAVPTDPYHGVAGIVAEGEAQGRWTVERLDQADTSAWIDALSRSDLVWLESPENPLITVADLPAICGASRPASTLVCVDSTFATPLLQQPLDLGADVVMHSATKFIGGHSDLLAGALVVRRDDLVDEFHERRLLQGATIGAMEAFLTTRGARTLHLRLSKAQDNAMELAQRLEADERIIRVRYPGLPSHETHGAAKSFMAGFGAMLSFETDGDADRCDAVLGRLELINHATSLGGVETTVERRASLAGQQRIPPTLVRTSVGCEHIDDLWSDLDRALG
ncbi:trans-sulfuration enzyme family protein [Ilumatobacter sp.]|uniref:trans-sulfuration enzyme family protein n=1 Tax=Ilumatobacter sp. TaxID=1967498 RepID=UPI003AF515EC